ACGATAYGLSRWMKDKDLNISQPVDVEVIPDPDVATNQPTQEYQLTTSGNSTLDTLLMVVIPINDPIDIAQRLEGKENIPLTLPVTKLERLVGEKETFWVTDTDTAENFQVDTTLAAVTDHLYFWIEDGVDYSQSALDKLAADFENNIYPINQEFFGSEWSPGVDEDPHLYVIYARGLGNNLAGYYASIDEYHPAVHEFSNAHETFMLSADNAGLREGYTFGVLAHEFQHMIHWYRDRNETSWLNEGFSELATLLTGHREGPTHDYYFADDPDTQLNDWPNDPNAAIPHYGNAFLFVTYFMDRFGSEATKALVSDDLNGLSSVDKVLSELSLTDSVTGFPITADDFFLDWVVTNYLKDEYNVTERFRYISYPDAPSFYATEVMDDCSPGENQRDVHQYAADYIELNCQGSYTLKFYGQDSVQVLPENPYSGNYAFWSNKGDQSDMRLTREFDFSNVSGNITFNYQIWYDLEEDYDYIFLEVSTDGEEWRIIRTPSSTSDDPSGNSYGWGYNGLSGGDGTWIEESVDLSNYAGEVIQIRFEYITDAAVHGEGLLLDSVSVPAINYFSDFETDNGGWIPEGFVRIENSLPQTYRLALIHLDAVPRVEYLSVSAGNELEIPIYTGENGSHTVVLVVTGTTRFTRQKASYWFEIISD
ncbi:MAG: immune inhibitor A, partial [Anaerolineales bacterium]|nr:immune inhibitor A [Anaerolineales bacterium]